MPHLIDDYFIYTIKSHTGNHPCSSVALADVLRTQAVRKNGDEYDRSERNLLFPPSTIKRFLTEENVKSVLGCICCICQKPPGGRDNLSDLSLIDILSRKTGTDADQTRRKFCVLLFMGAGFTARHVCSFDNRGLEISHQREILRDELFGPLYDRDLFNDLPSSENLTARFIDIFTQAHRLFHTPKLNVGDFNKRFLDVNLPFLKEKPLFGDADRHGRARVYKLDIHPEFNGSLPTALVRKELEWNDGDSRERDALHLIADSKQPHLIKLLCWYRFDTNVNYIFEHYNGSLEHILNGTMRRPLNAQPPTRYHGSKLKHWLWQGVVDIMASLAFFHTPVTPHVKKDDISGAHCDLKPANILVGDSGNLIVTDFGHAQLIKRGQGSSNTLLNVGDMNYQPPVPSPSNRGPSTDTSNPSWLQACDVWSMACVLIEVIVFIRGTNGVERVKQFRADTFRENQHNRAFWIATTGSYALRKIVRLTLQSFRSPQDQYLNSVTNLLEQMLSINPSERPTMAQCHAMISQNVPTDEWPLLDNGEVSISGLGTSTLLRNMLTQFAREIDSSWHRRRCKMYLLLKTTGEYDRIRLAIEFLEKPDGPEVTYVLSDSARLMEEVYKPLSLFDDNYTPRQDTESMCSFGIIHPNLRFIFEQPQDYYHFLTAVTKQKVCMFNDERGEKYVIMRTAKCRIRPPGMSVSDNRLTYGKGHVQIWKELSKKEFDQDFIPSPNIMDPVDRRDSASSTSTFSSKHTPKQLMGAAMTHHTGSSSSGSSTHNGPSTKTPSSRPNYRLVLWLPGTPKRYLTINLTSGLSKFEWESDAYRDYSPLHLTIRSVHNGRFLMGNFTDNDCPGIPLEPVIFEQAENFEASWVEIEFETRRGLIDCHGLCGQVIAKAKVSM